MAPRVATNEEPIPGYRLIERLGRGGFGEVWKAEAPGGLLKAVKFVFGDIESTGADRSQAAEQEWKALHRVKTIRHPYILSLERFEIIDGQLVIVMELADKNLWDRFRECRTQDLPGIPREELLRYMEEAAEALDLMNIQYQLQHLDIKPQNLFLVHNHIKVADFGLAKDFEGIRATVTGGVTPVYAAPETFDGWISRFSDQYSLAIVYQELLTGKRPFDGTNTRQLLMQHISGVPDTSPLPPSEREAINRALAKNPDERFPTCADLVRSLRGQPFNRTSNSGTAPTPPGNYSAPSSATVQTNPIRAGAPIPPRANTGAATNLRPAATPTAPMPHRPALPPLTTTSTSYKLPPLITREEKASGTTSVQSAGGNVSLTQQRSHVQQTQRAPINDALSISERTGDGCLMPTLIVSIGHVGLLVAQQFRQMISDRLGSVSAVPNIRLLHLDTDPDAIQDAAATPAPQTLTPKELILTRLNRPAHYVRKEGLPPIDNWLPSPILYKIARNPATNGIRLFGRLAFCDNYRLISQRLTTELEALINEDCISDADRRTQLGLRSTRPRIYIITSLGGGTGSGMFIDLAYEIRRQLRQFAQREQELVGIFLLPQIDRSLPRTTAIANTYASLMELAHFSSPFTTFDAKFDTKMPNLTDSDRPFQRCVLLPLPKDASPKPMRSTAAMAAGLLYTELLSPIGRVIDSSRTSYLAANPIQGLHTLTFGLHRLLWPRKKLLDAAVRRFGQRLLQRWITKDGTPLRESIEFWFSEEWKTRRMDIDATIARVREIAVRKLDTDPDKYMDSLLVPLFEPGGTQPQRFDQRTACEVFDQFIRFLGKPGMEDDPLPGSLHDLIQDEIKAIINECDVKLAEMAVYFIEQPQYRLAGAEEAIRCLTEKLKQLIASIELMHKESTVEISRTYVRVINSIGLLPGRNLAPYAELVDLMRQYGHLRLQAVILNGVLSVYRSLLTGTPEYLREVNFCRMRLAEVGQALSEQDLIARPMSGRGANHYLLPRDCKTVDQAADRFLAELAPEDLLIFDQNLQNRIRKQFKALVQVCLSGNDNIVALRRLILEQASLFLDGKLEKVDPAEIFYRHFSDAQVAQREIAHFYDEAAPEVLSPRLSPESQLCILGVPNNERGEQFRQQAREVIPESGIVFARSIDDIVFYREQRYIPLTDLPQFGIQAREVYQNPPFEEGISPHSRLDILWTPPQDC